MTKKNRFLSRIFLAQRSTRRGKRSDVYSSHLDLLQHGCSRSIIFGSNPVAPQNRRGQSDWGSSFMYRSEKWRLWAKDLLKDFGRGCHTWQLQSRNLPFESERSEHGTFEWSPLLSRPVTSLMPISRISNVQRTSLPNMSQEKFYEKNTSRRLKYATHQAQKIRPQNGKIY